QFGRLARGEAKLTEYSFSYTAPRLPGTSAGRVMIECHVVPESQPPTNVHVIIGRNGVGKTRLLRLMTRALVEPGASDRSTGKFASEDEDEGVFANLVSVSFSAFDEFLPLPDRPSE